MLLPVASFADELEKIALQPMGRRRPVKQQEELSSGGSLPTALAAGGAMMAATPASQAFGKSMMKGEANYLQKYGPTTVENLRSIKPHFGADVGNTVLHERGGVQHAMHIPKGGVMPKIFGDAGQKFERMQYEARGIPSTLVDQGFKSGVNIAPGRAGMHVGAHEMGHAAFRNTRLGRFTSKVRMPLTAGGSLASLGMAAGADPDSRTSKLAPWVGALSTAPVLGEEAMASMKALRAMRKAGVSGAQLAASRAQLAKAWGTYGAKILPGAVGLPILIRQGKKFMKRQRQLREMGQ